MIYGNKFLNYCTESDDTSKYDPNYNKAMSEYRKDIKYNKEEYLDCMSDGRKYMSGKDKDLDKAASYFNKAMGLAQTMERRLEANCDKYNVEPKSSDLISCRRWYKSAEEAYNKCK